MALTALLPACSASVNSVVAMGYDKEGRLIGAVKVCSGEVVRAEFTSLSSWSAESMSWKRDEPLTGGVEAWLLEGDSSGAWRAMGGQLPALDPGSEYEIWVSNEEGILMSHVLDFQGRDLARLRPGELLAERPGPADEDGYATQQLTVIRAEDLFRRSCKA